MCFSFLKIGLFSRLVVCVFLMVYHVFYVAVVLLLSDYGAPLVL